MKQLGSTGLPLGLFPTSRYTARRIQLEPGDSLLLFTDGISEARDLAGNDYGIDGLSLAASMAGLRGTLSRHAVRTWNGTPAGRGKQTIKRFWQSTWPSLAHQHSTP